MKGGSNTILTVDTLDSSGRRNSHELSEFTVYREKDGDKQFLSLGDTTGSFVYDKPENPEHTHLSQRIGELETEPTFINLSNGTKVEVVRSYL